MTKSIRVTCDTKLKIPLDELHEIQGDLKTMSVEAYTKFRQLVEAKGIWFATHVWKEPTEVNGKKAFRWNIVDGTGRRRMFMKMRDDDYDIPPIPCVEIEAKNLKEAKEAVLAASSMFHKIHGQGLYEFMGSDFEIGDLIKFDLPMNMEKFEMEFFEGEPPVDEPVGAEKEIVTFEVDPNAKKHECPRCGYRHG